MTGKTKLVLENMKCGGCANTITRALNELGLLEVRVDVGSNSVEVANPIDPVLLEKAIAKLHSLGYPLVKSEEGVRALALKAKSFVSCAIGRLR